MRPNLWETDIASLARRIDESFELRVRLCGEIECSVIGLETLPNPDDFWQPLVDAIGAADIAFDSIATEEGQGQFEFRLKPVAPLRAAQEVAQLKALVITQAVQHGLAVSFAAKPSPDQPGNGLHWHLHLENRDGMRVFYKQEETLSDALGCTLGGLLHTMPALMRCFAPSSESYTRFENAPDYVPRTASWGGNNRTVALRLPESVIPLRHIEHRVAGADACPFACVWALLVGIVDGLSQERDPGPQQFGDANRADLPRLPLSLTEAEAAMEQAAWLEEYIDINKLHHRLNAA